MTPQILVPLHTYPDGNSVAVAAHVAALARHLQADVHGLVLHATFPAGPSPIGRMMIDLSSMAREVSARCQTRGEALVQALGAALTPIGVRFDASQIDCIMGTIGSVTETGARYHDLIAVGLSDGDGAMAATAETMVFNAGRPVVLLPQDLPPTDYQHVMIAWDASRVAARAVADARDFLRLAKTVTIAVVDDEKALPEENPGQRLAGYLERHGIAATVARVKSERRPVARVLQDHALSIGAGLLVMGAFGHSRMRDFVLGGATTGILRDPKLPVLLSH